LNIVKKIFLSFLISILIIPLAIQQGGALIQYGGALEAEMSPGETLIFEWDLRASEGDGAITLELGSRGWGSQFFSLPDTLHIPEGEKGTVVITVTIPPDHPGGVILGEDHSLRASAKQSGEAGGTTIVNVQASKILIITILQNENEEYWSNTAYDEPEPVEPEVMEVETEEETMEKEEPSGPMTIGGAPTETQEEGGGCLISTATFGSELAPQVQMLREIRDNSLLNTESGTAFMTGFNTLYYSFSPTIADLERQSPIFREAVKITITPLISSLSILNHVDVNSEADVLGYGISLILLNIGMYIAAPVVLVTTIKNKIQKKK